MRKIELIRKVPVFSGKYGTFYDDEVRGPKGEARYSCWMPAYSGICVIPCRGQDIGLQPTYRYPIQQESIEVPRGLAEQGEELAHAAARELEEETGYRAARCRRLGQIFADTGLIMRHIDVFAVEVGERVPQRPDAMELIGELRWFAPDELRRLIANGELRCGITLAALMLLHASNAGT